jgi:hypothetical protein
MEVEALAAASEGVDALLGAGDRGGAAEASRRSAVASPVLAAMLAGKAARLLAGPDREGGRAVLRGLLEGRSDEDLLERGAQALSAGGYAEESARLRAEARFAAAEEALRLGDRERAAAEARRANEVRLDTETLREARVRSAGLLVRAGVREEALVCLTEAIARGWGGADRLEGDPAFAPLREDPAFRDLVERARRNAARGAEK